MANTATVTKNESLRVMPGGRTTQTLTSGDQVDIITGDDKGWMCVRSPDTGREGYVETGSIKIASVKAEQPVVELAPHPVLPQPQINDGREGDNLLDDPRHPVQPQPQLNEPRSTSDSVQPQPHQPNDGREAPVKIIENNGTARTA